MENKFSAFSTMTGVFNEKKRVPKNLDECREIEPVAAALNKWAETAFGGTCAIAISINLLGALVAAEAEEFMVFVPFAIFGWIVIAIGVFITNLIRGLASIVYNTGITANVALMNADNGEEPVEKETQKPVQHTVSHNSVFGTVPEKTENEPPRPPVHIKQTSKAVSKLEDELY